MAAVDGAVRRIAKLEAWSDADGKLVVDAWRRSGETRAEFGRRCGIAVHRLYYWSAKFGDGSAAAATAAGRKHVRFHPVRVVSDETAAGAAAGDTIEIRVIKVPRGIATEELRAVFSALRG